MKDDSRRSYVGYLPSPLTKQQCSDFFGLIKSGTSWLHPDGPLGKMPRKTAWMVKTGCSCNYCYGGVKVPPAVFPPWMTEIMTVLMPFFGLLDQSEWPNCCNVNLYEDGSHAVGWHTDDEKLFQAKHRDAKVLSLSLGQQRRFEACYVWPQDEEERKVSLLHLGDGDLCTMEGMFQKHLLHRVPKEDTPHGARINLTWRFVVWHAPECDLHSSKEVSS